MTGETGGVSMLLLCKQENNAWDVNEIRIVISSCDHNSIAVLLANFSHLHWIDPLGKLVDFHPMISMVITT
jgi:hypothetical protein